MSETQYQLIVLENLGVEFEVTVDGVLQLVTIGLRPSNKRRFPFFELRSQWPIERHAVTLKTIAVMVRIQAVAAPVGIGVVGVGGELQQDGRAFAGPGGSDNEKQRAGGFTVCTTRRIKVP